MGSFNVACSISNISINCGTKVAFIPLLPNEMNERIGRKYNKFNLKPGYVFLEPSANCVSNDGAFQFYKPFSLPIYAEYNDYGGIENIEENITTKAIKEYFGISIENFVDCIGARRSLYDYFSPVFGVYFGVDKKLISDYGVKFNEKWMTDMGFTKLEDGSFKYKDHDFTVVLEPIKADKEKHREDGFDFKIRGQKNKVVSESLDTYDNRKNFCNSYSEVTGYLIGYKEDCQDKIKLISKLSGMFVHREIYDYMTRNTFSEYSSKIDANSWEHDADLNDDSLKKLGFKLRCEDKENDSRYYKVYEYPGVTDYVILGDGTWSHIAKVSDKFPNGNPKQNPEHAVYHPSSLITVWKKLTGVDIIISEEIRKESKFGASFDQIRNEYIKFVNNETDDDDDDDESIREINNKRKEKLNLLKSNPEELKKEVDALKKDKKRLKLFSSLFISKEYDDDDFTSKKKKKAVKLTDAQIGKAIMSIYERNPYGGRNPLDQPSGHIYLPLKPSYDKYNMLKELYESAVVDGSIRNEVVKFCDFYWNCYSMNKVLMPAANGYQFGCHFATLGLALKTAELMKELVKDYEEEEEEI